MKSTTGAAESAGIDLLKRLSQVLWAKWRPEAEIPKLGLVNGQKVLSCSQEKYEE